MSVRAWVALAAAAFALGVAFLAGWQAATWRNDAKALAAERDRTKATAAAAEAARAVSVAYQQLTAELRRFDNVQRIEVNRETQRIEYRCPVPDTGARLLDAAIEAANAAAGGSRAAVPADRAPPPP